MADSALGRLREAIRALFASLGLEIHKEEEGYGIVKTLGVEAPGEGSRALRLRASWEKFWVVVAATEHVIANPVISTRTLMSLVGCWSWICLVARESLSIMNLVYRFILEAEDLDVPRRLTEGVLLELMALVAIALWLSGWRWT